MWKNKIIRLLSIVGLVAVLVACTSTKTLIILHTNDTHSQVEPLTGLDSQSNNKGGYAARADMIDSLRKQGNPLILVDAGDFLQGTPYFNFFKGILEAETFNSMHYDAITLGNHEFDNGVDSLANVLAKLNMPVVCSNYIVSNAIAPYVKSECILIKNGLRIGIIGLGINPQSLISEKNFAGITYLDPITTANNYAQKLKKEEKCDLVICLSHLGDDSPTVNDVDVAKNSRNIDLIIGGHTHKLIPQLEVKDLDNKTVVISQAGKSGTYLGYIQLKLVK